MCRTNFWQKKERKKERKRKKNYKKRSKHNMSPKLRLGDIIIGPTLSVTSVMLISVHHVVAVSYVDKHNLDTLIIFSFISFLINQQVTTIL
jgi:hypothetical protein